MMRGSRTSGFTLIELIAAIVVVSLVSATVVTVIGESVRGRLSSAERSVGVELARSLMEEILSQSFEDPEESAGSFGSEEGGRSAFDDVDDYDDWVEDPPSHAGGAPIAGADAFRRAVWVRNVSESDPDALRSDGSTDLKRVEIEVKGIGSALRLYGLKAKL